MIRRLCFCSVLYCTWAIVPSPCTAEDELPREYELRREHAIFKGHMTPGAQNPVDFLCFLGGGRVASCNQTGLKLWKLMTLEEVASLTFGDRGANVAFSPDEKWLAATGLNKPIQLYDTATWKVR